MSIPQFQHLRVTAPRIGCVCLPLWLIETKDQGIAVALTRVRIRFARYLPGWLGRIEFAFATDWSFSSSCSPLRKRSYHRIRGGNVTPERTFSVQTPSKAHERGRPRPQNPPLMPEICNRLRRALGENGGFES